MDKAYLFYNPLAGGGRILEDLEALEFVLDEDCVFCDMTKPETYEQTLFDIKPDDMLVLCGGDGTLHRFANLTAGLQRKNDVFYYPAGENNNFARTFGRGYGCKPFCISDWLKDLPVMQLRNRCTYFLTGIVFQAEDKTRRISCRKKRYNAPVAVSAKIDGTSYRYEKVHFVSVMFGKYCCGMTPDPSRKRTDRDLSVVVVQGCGKLRAQYLLARLRKGRNVNSRYLTVCRAETVHISFGAPVGIWIDGEEQSGIDAFSAGVNPGVEKEL